MGIDSAGANDQGFGHLGIGQTLCNQPQYLSFPLGQFIVLPPTLAGSRDRVVTCGTTDGWMEYAVRPATASACSSVIARPSAHAAANVSAPNPARVSASDRADSARSSGMSVQKELAAAQSRTASSARPILASVTPIPCRLVATASGRSSPVS